MAHANVHKSLSKYTTYVQQKASGCWSSSSSKTWIL